LELDWYVKYFNTIEIGKELVLVTEEGMGTKTKACATSGDTPGGLQSTLNIAKTIRTKIWCLFYKSESVILIPQDLMQLLSVIKGLSVIARCPQGES